MLSQFALSWPSGRITVNNSAGTQKRRVVPLFLVFTVQTDEMEPFSQTSAPWSE
jgi:hypothetical protein